MFWNIRVGWKTVLHLGSVSFWLMVAGCGSSEEKQPTPREIVVYAAASTTEVIEEAGRAFTTQTGTKIGFEFGSSGALARKIEAGSPTDVFISADERWIEYAEEKNLLNYESLILFARSSLVCIVPAESEKSPVSPAELAGLGRISVGDPAHVPAGRYANEALSYYGLWDTLLGEGKIVLTMDVRAAMSYVEQGAVQAGIVYSTDAVLSNGVKVAFEFPDESHSPITYHAGIVARTSNKAEAIEFINFLGSEKFQKIIISHGFKTP